MVRIKFGNNKKCTNKYWKRKTGKRCSFKKIIQEIEQQHFQILKQKQDERKKRELARQEQESIKEEKRKEEIKKNQKKERAVQKEKKLKEERIEKIETFINNLTNNKNIQLLQSLFDEHQTFIVDNTKELYYLKDLLLGISDTLQKNYLAKIINIWIETAIANLSDKNVKQDLQNLKQSLIQLITNYKWLADQANTNLATELFRKIKNSTINENDFSEDSNKELIATIEKNTIPF